VVASSFASAVHVWDLRAIRTRLKEMNLDWDWPAFQSGTDTSLGNALTEQQKLDVVIDLDPISAARAQTNRGSVLQQQGKLAEALAAFEEAVRLQPDNATAHFELASVLAQSKRWDRSAAVYAEALRRFGAPNWPGPWYDAIRSDEVFTRLTALRPDDRLPWIAGARLHVLQRDWKRAAADYARIHESLARINQAELLGDAEVLIGYACLLVLQGDHAGYEQLCKKWAHRVGDLPGWDYQLARAWAVSPRPVVPARQIVARAEKVVQADRAPWCLHVLSLAHYRNGDFDLAIKLAEESNAANWRGGAKALNWLVLAMAHSRLGHATDARHALGQALALGGRANPEQPPGVQWPDMSPPDIVEFELLRREAEELIDPQSPEKPAKKRS
jgi:tetratricopeptide (TPR) repeat protein